MSLARRLDRLDLIAARERPAVLPDVDLAGVHQRLARAGLSCWNEAKGYWSPVAHRELLAAVKARVAGGPR